MKLPIALTVAALAVPLTSAALVRDAEPARAAPRDGVEFEGAIGGWIVEEDGRVLVRLELENGKSLWLRTAANQSSATQFELLALHTLLALGDKSRQQGLDVFVRGDATAERDGESVEDAMRLTAIGRR